MSKDPFGHTPQEVEGGRMVRTAYINLRNVFESAKLRRGYTYRPPLAYDGHLPRSPEENLKKPIWPSIARLCWSHNVEILPYLAFCFEQRALRDAPEPTHLLSPKSVAAYMQMLRAESGGRSARLMRAELQTAAAEIYWHVHYEGLPDADAALAVAVDDHGSLTPLFRYCLLCSLNTKASLAAAKRLLPRASHQYIKNPAAYGRGWKSLLPQEFDRTARRAFDVCGANLKGKTHEEQKSRRQKSRLPAADPQGEE